MTPLPTYIHRFSTLQEVENFTNTCTVHKGKIIYHPDYSGKIYVDTLINKVIKIIGKNPHFSEEERKAGKKLSHFFIKYHGSLNKVTAYSTWTVYDIQTVFQTYTAKQWQECFPDLPLPYPKGSSFELRSHPVRYDPVDQLKALSKAKL